MGSLPVLKPREVAARLERLGFRECGSAGPGRPGSDHRPGFMEQIIARENLVRALKWALGLAQLGSP
jgi:predicted RNA binding protein YcfA (HicA-like mRNA interferase family)